MWRDLAALTGVPTAPVRGRVTGTVARANVVGRDARLIRYADANAGVVFVEWDEGATSAAMAFVAAGPGVKKGYAGSVPYDHGSILKSIEEILGLPTLPTVSGGHDLADLFRAGQFP